MSNNDMNTLWGIRDPSCWFCLAIDENGIPRLFAHGDSEQDARKSAERAVTAYRDRKQEYRDWRQERRVMAPRSAWTFITCPPST